MVVFYLEKFFSLRADAFWRIGKRSLFLSKDFSRIEEDVMDGLLEWSLF
ncbi:MAG: hypothetical protein F6K39_43525 [Okeania sp. SIO3B3]|nr:hypothetical protein [Okeania sp. SIO3B3]